MTDGRALLLLLLAGLLTPAWSEEVSSARGRDLAHSYCQACHLFPEPSLLDKETWANGALRRMAPLLGVATINLENRPDGKILKDGAVFPPAPLVSREDWLAICRFYQENAPAAALPQAARAEIGKTLPQFAVRRIDYPGGKPLVTLLKIDPEQKLIYVGNALEKCLDLVTPAGKLVSRIPLDSAPTSINLRPEGMYLTLIGDVFPSDEKKGKLVLASSEGDGFKVKTLLENLPRPTSALLADLNADAREDILLCSFGNYLGKLSWFENTAAGGYRERLLLPQPGGVNAVLDGSGIFVLMAQAREGIHYFSREGGAELRGQALAEFNPAFGATHLELADFDGDGRKDLLLTNGDNGDYPSPFKNYHGIRILRNEGKNKFTEAWFFPLNGAFKALAADFDGDGDLDIAAIAFFPDYRKSPEESFVFLENKGAYSFAPFSFPSWQLGRWLTMDAADADGDGDADIVLGSFVQGPVSVPIPAALQDAWRTNGASVVWLENLRPKRTKAKDK